MTTKINYTKMETQKGTFNYGRALLIGLIFAVVVIFLITRFACKGQQTITTREDINTALADSMKTWKDKEGNYKAQITAIQDENADYFLTIKSKEADVIRLQNVVKQYKNQIDRGGSATVISTEADINLTGETQVTKDKEENPVYTSDFEFFGTGKYAKTKWVWGKTIATKDSTTVGLRFYEELDVVIGVENTGFLGLGRGKAFANVTLHNPFNKVTTVRSYSDKPAPRKRFGVGPVGAYGIFLGETPKFGFFGGVGVTYDLIQF